MLKFASTRRVAQSFEQAEQRDLARLDARPQVEGRVGARRHGLQAPGSHVGLAGRDQGPPDAVAPVLRRDHEDPDEALAGRAGRGAAFDRGDQPDVGIAADDRGLLRGEERPLELVDGRRVEQRPCAQRVDRAEIRRPEKPEARIVHRADATSPDG